MWTGRKIPAEAGTPTEEPAEAGTPTEEPAEAGTPTEEPAEAGTPTGKSVANSLFQLRVKKPLTQPKLPKGVDMMKMTQSLKRSFLLAGLAVFVTGGSLAARRKRKQAKTQDCLPHGAVEHGGICPPEYGMVPDSTHVRTPAQDSNRSWPLFQLGRILLVGGALRHRLQGIRRKRQGFARGTQCITFTLARPGSMATLAITTTGKGGKKNGGLVLAIMERVGVETCKSSSTRRRKRKVSTSA
jgi:hypothetical protein